jgi:hypothetical protein
MAITFNAPSQIKPYANLSAFPATGAVKTIYIASDTNKIYRWNGSAYVQLAVTDLGDYVPYTGATQDVNLGAYDAYINKLWLYDAVNDNYGSTHYTDGNYHIEDADGHKLLVIEDGFMQIHKTDTIQSNLFTSDLTATRDHYLPDESGTIALIEQVRTIEIDSVTIVAGDWVADSGIFKYTYTDSHITALKVVEIIPANDAFSIVQGIEVLPLTESFDGYVEFYCNNLPTENFNVTILVRI